MSGAMDDWNHKFLKGTLKVVGQVLDKCTRTPPLASLADHKNEKNFS